MKTILFQGDSITDANRNRDHDSHLGCGYAMLTGSQLMYDHPGELRCLNLGVSGDRIVDTYVDALGHDWDAGTVVKEPTEEETGLRKYVCSRCAEEKT